MLKSFITLKPASPISLKKLSFFHKKKKKKNLLNESLEQIFRILNYLSLSQILILYRIYKRSKDGKQIQNKITQYLIITDRRYTTCQQKQFLKDFIQYSDLKDKQLSKLKEQKISIVKYNTQNSTWRQSINQDVQRTYIASNLMSMKNSTGQLLHPKYTDNHYNGKNGQQKSKLSQYQKTKSMSFSSSNINQYKYNYHIYNNRNIQLQIIDKKKQLIKNKQSINFKNYLKTVLNAISNRNKQIGYVQGLNFWIKNMYESKLTQQQSFITACFILQKMNAEMLFKQQMTKVRQLCYVLEIYLFNNIPNIYYLLKKYDVSSILYASNWFITLFSEQLPKRIVNKLWNLYLIKGWKILIKFSVSVICNFQQQIHNVHPDQIYCYMRNILDKIDTQKQNKIWILMNSIKVSNKMIDYLSKQMRILSNDTEIQLWRLEQQRKQIQKMEKRSSKRYSFSCQSNVFHSSFVSGSQRKFSIPSNILEEQQQKGLCYSNIHKQGKQCLKTEASQRNSNFLSFCKSVSHI